MLRNFSVNFLSILNKNWGNIEKIWKNNLEYYDQIIGGCVEEVVEKFRGNVEKFSRKYEKIFKKF